MRFEHSATLTRDFDEVRKKIPAGTKSVHPGEPRNQPPFFYVADRGSPTSGDRGTCR